MVRAGAITHDHGHRELVAIGRYVFQNENTREAERDIRRAIADGFRAEGLGGVA